MNRGNFTYSYPRPALTTDCVLLCLGRENIEVLLIKRKNEPFKDCWAFPGGFVEEGESAEEGAKRELEEETSLKNIQLTQLGLFSRPGRDPRGWTVSAAFFACVSRDIEADAIAQDDAKEAKWFPLDEIPPMAFDHKEILEATLQRVKSLIPTEPFIFDLLPRFFIFDQIDTLFTSLFGDAIDAFEWLEKMQHQGVVKVHNEDIPSYSFHPVQKDKANPLDSFCLYL